MVSRAAIFTSIICWFIVALAPLAVMNGTGHWTVDHIGLVFATVFIAMLAITLGYALAMSAGHHPFLVRAGDTFAGYLCRAYACPGAVLAAAIIAQIIGLGWSWGLGWPWFCVAAASAGLWCEAGAALVVVGCWGLYRMTEYVHDNLAKSGYATL